LVKDAETGQRGYLLSGETLYLPPYQNALAEISQALEILKASIKDNPTRQTQVNQLEQTVKAKLAELAETVEIRQRQGFEQALQIVLTDRVRTLMQDIRRQITTIEGKVKSELTESNQRLENQVRFTLTTIIVAIVIALGAVSAASFVIRRDLIKRRFAEIALQGAKAELETRVAERTAELAQANLELEAEIGERKQTENTLRESEARYRVLSSPSTSVPALRRA
jgi:CHASE3 domain sensor protein